MQWKIFPKKSNDLVEQLLLNRGIRSSKERKQFFHPQISDFKKELELSGIEKAQKRILQAKEKDELVVVFGDYDVDGICSCAILYKGLTSIGVKVLPYIPHREKEGYGLSKVGLDFAKSSGAQLVITVDNGIVAFEQAEYAKNLDLDLIITDHHLPQDKKPNAYAIVHSTKMCGAAVAWCLIRGMIQKDLEYDLLQFVAIATVCDLMPLVGLGRAFVAEGLKVLDRTTNLGMLALINESNITLASIGSYEIGHIIGPRLNAMGRLEHAIDSLRLLCTKDPQKAKRLAQLLSSTNAQRQKQTIDAIDQAKLQVDQSKTIHVLISKIWSQGIIGLVAGRISEQFARPAIAISKGETISKGSARSIDGINIVEVIRKHKDILIDVGGHPGAAGFSILNEHIKIFKKRLENEEIPLPESEKVLEIDAEVDAGKLTKSLVDDLKKFEPFGLGNPRPIFATNMQISDIRTVGDGKHLKFKASPSRHPDPELDSGEGSQTIDAIAFGMGELKDMLSEGQSIDLAYSPETDDFNGYEKIQLKVRDIRIN